jgi:DNA-binding Lrp family transcriptional regulator
LDYKILSALTDNANMQPKDLAKMLGVDRRTLAKHLSRMKECGLLRIRVDIDWSLLGVGISAYLGSTTALGEEDVAKLYDFIRHEPRVVEAYSTVGSNEYFLKILDVNLQTFREEVLRKLEPLTADLSTSIISSRIKSEDYAGFMNYLRQKKGPGAG